MIIVYKKIFYNNDIKTFSSVLKNKKGKKERYMRKKYHVLFYICLFMMLCFMPMRANAAVKLNNMSAKQIVNMFKKSDFPISKVCKYDTNGNDVFSKYKSKINFYDGNYEATLRVYYNESDAKKRYNYIKGFKNTILREKVYRCGNVVINANPNIKTVKWNRYKKGLQRLNAGKQIQNYPLSLNKNSITLNVKKTFKLKLGTVNSKKVKWTSSNKKIATVFNGKITTRSAGKCIITAKYKNKKYKCTVNVPNPINVTIKVNYFDNSEIAYTIKNNSSNDITVSNSITLQDLYNWGYLYINLVDYEEVPWYEDITLRPSESKVLYYTNRNDTYEYFMNNADIELKFKMNGKTYTFYYNESAPGKIVTEIY